MNRLSAISIATTLLLAACSSSTEDTTTLADPNSGTPLNPGIAEGEPNPTDSSGGTSMPAPDADSEPLSSVPGGDTSAVAGYWDGTTADGGERYFVIAPNGLWTEYFLTYEGELAGNCYWIAGPQTLTPEDPSTNAYSLSDGRELILSTDTAGTTLTVSHVLESKPAESWPAVVGRVPSDLPLCQAQ